MRYGESFRKNNYLHFPDMVSLDQQTISMQNYNCFKCDQRFESFEDLILHVRSHELTERDPEDSGSDYCEVCKLDIRAGHPNHKTSIAVKETVHCIICSMRIFRSGQNQHYKYAHPNDYFR